MKKEERGYFPYWMRESLPDSDRVKYLDKEIILKRLKNGEMIRFAPDYWRKVAPMITFEKDTRLMAIRRNTFESMKRKNIIKCNNPPKFLKLDEREFYSLTPKK